MNKTIELEHLRAMNGLSNKTATSKDHSRKDIFTPKTLLWNQLVSQNSLSNVPMSEKITPRA